MLFSAAVASAAEAGRRVCASRYGLQARARARGRGAGRDARERCSTEVRGEGGGCWAGVTSAYVGGDHPRTFLPPFSSQVVTATLCWA